MNKEKLLINHSQDSDKFFYNLNRYFIKSLMFLLSKNRLFIIVSLLLVLVSFNTWIDYFDKTNLNQFLLFLVAIGSFIGLVYILKHQIKIRNFKQDYKNDEREVKLNLEFLQKQGFKIYDNLIVNDCKLDYVAVSTKGIFAIKIKSYTKPIKGLCKIVSDGDIVSFYNGKNESDTPINQAKDSAKWLNNYLKARIKKDFNVFPIVIFVGWYTRSNILLNDILMLNPKGLAKFLQDQKHELFFEDVALITNEIDIYSQLKNNI